MVYWETLTLVPLHTILTPPTLAIEKHSTNYTSTRTSSFTSLANESNTTNPKNKRRKTTTYNTNIIVSISTPDTAIKTKTQKTLYEGWELVA